MGLYDAIFDLHGAYRHAAITYEFKNPEAQAGIFKSWRQYAVLTATDLGNKSVAPHYLDDSVSEVLLDVGFRPKRVIIDTDRTAGLCPFPTMTFLE